MPKQLYIVAMNYTTKQPEMHTVEVVNETNGMFYFAPRQDVLCSRIQLSKRHLGAHGLGVTKEYAVRLYIAGEQETADRHEREMKQALARITAAMQLDTK